MEMETVCLIHFKKHTGLLWRSTFFSVYFLCMSMCLVYICVPCAGRILQRPEEALDPLELELQMVVSCRVGTGN